MGIKILVNNLEVSEKLSIFADEKKKAMEEKRYPKIDEEQGIDICCEPVAESMQDFSVTTSKRPDGGTEVHDWIDDLDWNSFPILGPKSEEEAIARIDRFEERLAKNEVNWYSSDEVDKMLFEKYPWLR